VLLLVLLAGGAVATAVGAVRYAGGSWVEPSAPGHSLWANFLCDLARDMAVNGRPNPGAAWGRAAEWVLVAALCLFWWTVPPLLDLRSRARVVSALGTAATLVLVLVPVTVGLTHAVVLTAGAVPGFLATVLAVRGLRARPLLALLGAVTLLLAMLSLGLFLTFRDGPLPVSVPAMQRLALLAAVGWMAACAVAALRVQPVEPVASSTASPRAT
jgi:hypothetical protein